MKSRKKSSKGDPSGTTGAGPADPATVVLVVIFTTEGLIFSARSAKLSGAPRAGVETVWARSKKITAKASEATRVTTDGAK
jgi:hypothetical protein